MSFFTAKNNKELRDFMKGKTIERFYHRQGFEFIRFTDGTGLRFYPYTNATHGGSSVSWKAQIIVNPVQKDGRISWNKKE